MNVTIPKFGFESLSKVPSLDSPDMVIQVQQAAEQNDPWGFSNILSSSYPTGTHATKPQSPNLYDLSSIGPGFDPNSPRPSMGAHDSWVNLGMSQSQANQIPSGLGMLMQQMQPKRGPQITRPDRNIRPIDISPFGFASQGMQPASPQMFGVPYGGRYGQFVG
jgi:hypothetical protein